MYNYINDNKDIKNKKKKRTKKKKGKKIENQIKNYNEENKDKEINDEEDIIVKQFKQDIEQKVINRNDIHKVKPKISDEWIKKFQKIFFHSF